MWVKIDESTDNKFVIETYAMDVGMGVVIMTKSTIEFDHKSVDYQLSTSSVFVPGLQLKDKKLVTREGYGQVPPVFSSEQTDLG